MKVQQKSYDKLVDIVCVKATLVCQLASELEKHDAAAVKRIFDEAREHRIRHEAERN